MNGTRFHLRRNAFPEQPRGARSDQGASPVFSPIEVLNLLNTQPFTPAIEEQFQL
jgi:hypothetical protein